MFEKCKNHFYHKGCAEHLAVKSSLKCAMCGHIYGILVGNMPQGTMTSSVSNSMKCSGYEKYGTIVIGYNFPSGVCNGVKSSGTSRVAYLLNSKEGKEVLNILKNSLDRQVTFGLGTSVTTGSTNTIVSNTIQDQSLLS